VNENARKWVEALRSGEYTQTQGVLRDESGYCCLGVACVVYETATETKIEGPEWDPDHWSADEELPDDVRDWLGSFYTPEHGSID
jgi:hypothetical protein